MQPTSANQALEPTAFPLQCLPISFSVDAVVPLIVL
jgi:hypothetical protein